MFKVDEDEGRGREEDEGLEHDVAVESVGCVMEMVEREGELTGVGDAGGERGRVDGGGQGAARD